LPTTFVLVNTEIEPGVEKVALEAIKKIEGVEEAYAVYGVYDIIARVNANTMDELNEIVNERIRKVEKVRSTLTMIVVEPISR